MQYVVQRITSNQRNYTWNGSNTIHSGFGIPCHNPLHYI